MLTPSDDDARAPRVIAGHLTYRVNNGPLTTTSFYLEITATSVRKRYADGVDHLSTTPEVIAFFSDFVPSLEPAGVS